VKPRWRRSDKLMPPAWQRSQTGGTQYAAGTSPGFARRARLPPEDPSFIVALGFFCFGERLGTGTSCGTRAAPDLAGGSGPASLPCSPRWRSGSPANPTPHRHGGPRYASSHWSQPGGNGAVRRAPQRARDPSPPFTRRGSPPRLVADRNGLPASPRAQARCAASGRRPGREMAETDLFDAALRGRTWARVPASTGARPWIRDANRAVLAVTRKWGMGGEEARGGRIASRYRHRRPAAGWSRSPGRSPGPT